MFSLRKRNFSKSAGLHLVLSQFFTNIKTKIIKKTSFVSTGLRLVEANKIGFNLNFFKYPRKAIYNTMR